MGHSAAQLGQADTLIQPCLPQGSQLRFQTVLCLQLHHVLWMTNIPKCFHRLMTTENNNTNERLKSICLEWFSTLMQSKSVYQTRGGDSLVLYVLGASGTPWAYSSVRTVWMDTTSHVMVNMSMWQTMLWKINRKENDRKKVLSWYWKIKAATLHNKNHNHNQTVKREMAP